jgi:hypothetical protein
MKGLCDVIASNGVPFLQMRSVGSHSTSGREKEGKEERTGGFSAVNISVRSFCINDTYERDVSESSVFRLTVYNTCINIIDLRHRNFHSQ